MKETIRYAVTLTIICSVASGTLAAVNAATKTRIIAQAMAEEEASLEEVLPEAAHFEAVKSQNEEIIYYKAHDKEGKLIGAAFKASAKGYSSVIETMAGISRDGTIRAIKVLSQNETPGLGAKIIDPDFTGQFTNKKDLNNIQAITGATISSTAVINSVKIKAEELRKLMENEK